jgi:hypothetical protein
MNNFRVFKEIFFLGAGGFSSIFHVLPVGLRRNESSIFVYFWLSRSLVVLTAYSLM